MKPRILGILAHLLRIAVLATTIALVCLASTAMQSLSGFLEYLSITLLVMLLLYIVVEALYRMLRVSKQ